MSNNDFMYAVERSDEYLAHYGIRGMKWGVRRAIASGNSARLGRQYAKAQKKLAKLEKQASNSKKYARRAALMGAGAAAAGGLAAAGTGGVARGIAAAGGAGMKASRAIGGGLKSVGSALGAYGRTPGKSNPLKRASTAISVGMNRAGSSMQTFGANHGALHKAGFKAAKTVNKWGKSNSLASGAASSLQNVAGRHGLGQQASEYTKRLSGVSNNTIARIGAGAVGAGLAVGAARNAYKAATAKKRAEKFRSAMNESFKGTKYANGGQPRQGKKRRNRG